MNVNVDEVDAIFCAAIELLTPEERADYLANVCGDNADLRRRVDELLAAHFAAGSFLDARPTLPQLSPHFAIPYGPGSTIGPYQLLEQVGEGGMGVVFKAEQSRPVQRTVALKIIKPGMNTRQVIARFEAERQALAVMDHPNIARVFDAGTTEMGLPYFVMELVHGVPITRYCDEHRFAPSRRLELFIAVCQAVQHAHQKGIIHRDLKPTNILVSEYDGRPVAKIIDFGVAKAVGEPLTDNTLMTEVGQVLGTIEYMSPEQAKLNQLDIDTRTDIYSLGVLLYELLTGTTPFDARQLRSAAFDEMLRTIREVEPPKPSTRLSSSDALPSIAANRGLEPSKLTGLVRGDLDWIALKTLDKDRNRRYETANSLAIDIEHYLANEPVAACPPSRIYRFRKFARRNRGALIALITIATALVLGTGVSVWQAIRATIAEDRAARNAATAELLREEAVRERKRAEENLLKAKQAVDTWFTQVGQDLERQPHMTNVSRALLEQALEFYQGFLKQKGDDPEMRFEAGLAYQRVVSIYRQLGRDKECLEPTHTAVAIFEKLSSEFPENTEYREKLAELYGALGLIYYFSGRVDEAPPWTQRALADWEKLARRFPDVPKYQRTVAVLLVDLGNQLAALPGKLDEAEKHCRESLVWWERFREQFPDLAPGSQDEGHSHHWLAAVLSKNCRYEEVEHHLRRSVELRDKIAAENPKSVSPRHALAHARIYLGKELLRKGLLPECETEFRSAITLLQPLLDDFPDRYHYRRQLKQSYLELSTTLFSQRRYEEAEKSAREAIALQSSDHDGWAYYDLGLIVHRRNKIQEAAELFRQAFQRFEQGATKSPEDLAGKRRAQKALRWALVTCPLPQFRDPQRALGIAKELAQVDPLSDDCWTDMGIAHYRLDQFDEAIEAIQKSNELNDGGDSYNFYLLAMAHHERGEPDEAHRWYQRAVEHKQNRGGSNNPDLVNIRDEAATLLGIETETQSNAAVENGQRPDDKQ